MDETKKVWPIVLGVLFTAFLANYLIWYLTGKPHLYCLGKWSLLPLFAPWWHLVLPILIAAMLYVLMSGKGWRAGLQVGALMLLVGGLPNFSETLFGLGVGCPQ